MISVLQALADADLLAHFTVVGTHALYAYETSAGVRIVPGALATQDIDLLWDARRRVQFMTDLQQLDASMLEGDLWPVQALRASVLTSAPRFEHAVVSATGRMAWMPTIAPATFVEFKRWMAQSAPGRAEGKRRRDRLQADIVQELLDQQLLLQAPR